jgi:geranylgeranyl diphosphate synthase type I
MNIINLRSITWNEQLIQFEQLLQNEINHPGHSSDLIEAVKHQVLSGGKRIRAVLPLFIYQYLTNRSQQTLDPICEQNAKWLGLALELLHSSTLCHDDVMDQDHMRRERPTVWSRYGMPQAINAGNILMYLSEEAVHQTHLSSENKLIIMQFISKSLRRVIHGQGREIQLRRDKILPDKSTYQEIIRGKTGALFALGLIMGSLVSIDLPASEPLLLAELGLKLGEIFQIQDDIIDLLGNKGRDRLGSDLWEGKPSWFIAEIADKLTAKEREKLQETLYIPRENKKEADVALIISLLKEKGALTAGEQFLNGIETLHQEIKENFKSHENLVDYLFNIIKY